MNIKSGDYVDYTAGNWTKKEIEDMGILYSGENIPDSTKPYTFGGFKVGQSKDAGIKANGSNSLLDTENSGWRVLSVNNDGSVNLIHGGTPEYYYHPTYYKTTASGNQYKSAYRSKYILGGEKDESATEDSFENAKVKEWKVYEDKKFAVDGSAHLINDIDLQISSRVGTN